MSPADRPRALPAPAVRTGWSTLRPALTFGLTVGQSGARAPEATAKADPTEAYGVGLSRIRTTAPAYFDNRLTDQHILWMQESAPLPVSVRFTGRRIDFAPVPGTLCIYPAGSDSIAETGAPGSGRLIRVSAECLSLAVAQSGASGAGLVERVDGRDDVLFRIGETLDGEAAAGHPNGMLFWSAAADAFIRRLCGHHLSTAAAPQRGSVDASSLRRLDAYIQANLGGQLDLGGLADVVGCDRFHFAHRFRATVGISPHRYVMRLRLDRACALIRSGSGALADIALATGFTDQSHLSRWMRRVYNLRPKDLRI